MENIKNINVWGIDESLKASGYPMSNGEYIDVWPDPKRGKILGTCTSGSGHDCYLKGIIVQFDWRISQVIYPQVERYHFIDIVSSQSKMHRLHLAKEDDFNPNVDEIILERFLALLKMYNASTKSEQKEMFPRLVYSCPMGYELTARFTTNYLQLKTIYHQRKNHKIQEWVNMCKWIETLPLFKVLVLKEENNGQ